MSKKHIGILVGSLRRESYSKKIALEVAKLMPNNFDMKILELNNLSIFNQDYDDDGGTPGAWRTFREQVKELDGFLFVTPEYNRSIPPVLKNAIDIASRPYGQNAWSGKPGAIISVTPGSSGALGAYQHLKQTVDSLNIFTLPQPEMYIRNVDSLLDADGHINNKRTLDWLQGFADAFAGWVERFSS
jgi:chromate reductase